MRNKKQKMKIFPVVVFLIFLLFSCSFAFAQYKNQEKIPGAQPTQRFDQYLKDIINFGFATIGILALFMIVIGAYQYLMAAGNIGKVDSAKETIFSAIFGLILGLCAWIILEKINPDLVRMELKNISVFGSGITQQTATSSGTPSPNAGKCVEGTGNCAVGNMSCFGSQAKNASIVCNAESGGVVGTGGDKCGGTNVSFGLMQMNTSCHDLGLECTGAYSCCIGTAGCNNSNCTVVNSNLAANCQAAMSDPTTNLQAACKEYNTNGWKPWSGANKCGIS